MKTIKKKREYNLKAETDKIQKVILQNRNELL